MKAEDAGEALRIAFFGLPLAAWLLAGDGHDLRLAVLPKVAAPGRRRLERALGAARVFEAGRLGAGLDAAVAQALEREEPDLIVSWFWTRRLPQRVLAGARLGGIGVHPSLLPRHRGPDPYFWAIDSGDEESGVTVHRLSERYDDGEVIAQRRLGIGSRNAWQLARALDRPSIAALRDAVRQIARGQALAGLPQDERLATWAPAPSGDELRVDFRWTTERVLRRLRALCPVPALTLDVEGFIVTLLEAAPSGGAPSALEPGEACVAGEPPRLVFRTGDGGVRVERAIVERAGVEQLLFGAELGVAVRDHLAGRAERGVGRRGA